MKREINIPVLALCLMLYGQGHCYAQNQSINPYFTQGLSNTQPSVSANNNFIAADSASLSSLQPVSATVPAVNTLPNNTDANVPVASKTVSLQDKKLVAPVVPAPKHLLAPANRKVDLHAIIFDPAVTVKPPENASEMTKGELAKYDIERALKCEVSVPSTKGLLEDTMKMTFTKGPVEYISPWVDFNGSFSNIWSGADYKNSTYNINFQDVGFNGKFRTKDDPKSGKKTLFRLMYNTGKLVPGYSYMEGFMADNYIMRYWSKDDQVLAGYARAAVGIEGGESPFTIPFFNRSQISRTYGNVRTLGIKAQGNHKYYDYSAGIFSSGRFFQQWFPGPEFVGLFSVKPLAFANGKYGNLIMGGSLNSGSGAIDRYSVTGVHAIYDYKRLKITTEYAKAEGSNGSTGYTGNASEGFYGTVAYRITPRLQILGRYDKFDPNRNAVNDVRTEYTAGLNYFIRGQALKLMLNYTYYTVENGLYGSRIMAGTQIIL